jgi:replicative superfamily II helicase
MDGNKQILVCTPEMMLYIFKKMYQDNIFKYINLLLIDEVHLIGCEKRG